MAIEFTCEKCKKRLRAPDDAVGKKAKCQCGNTLVITLPNTADKLLDASSASGESSADTADLTGKTIGGFRVIRKIGQGGMGAVWKAHDENLKRDVAIKTLTADAFATESAYQRFLQEAQSAAKLISRNTVAIYAAGRDGLVPYMAMEFIEGESVGAILDREKKIPVSKAIGYIKQAAHGLSDAHEHGIVHRDIKPDNLMVNRKGVVKVADFGLARNTSKNNDRLTTAGQIMGTPAFMSPEQAEGKDTDFRSDIYSLGATLYTMIAGERPFKGETSIRIIMNVIDGVPTDIRQYVPDINPAVKRLIDKMMAKRSCDRPQTYEALVKELDEANNFTETLIVENEIPQASLAPPKPAPVKNLDRTDRLENQTASDDVEPTLQRRKNNATREGKKFPKAMVGGLAGVVVIVIVLAVMFGGGSGNPAGGQASAGKPKRFFSGLIDDVKLWNHALDPSQVSDAYNGKATNMVSHWKMDNDNWVDSNGGNNGSVSLGSPVFSTTAKIGTHSVSFDGSSGINCGDASSLTLSNGSIQIWIKTTDVSPGAHPVIEKKLEYSILIRDGKVGYYDWGTPQENYSTQFVADGQWHCITLTFQNEVANGTKMYIDGKLAITSSVKFVKGRNTCLTIGYEPLGNNNK